MDFRTSGVKLLPPEHRFTGLDWRKHGTATSGGALSVLSWSPRIYIYRQSFATERTNHFADAARVTATATYATRTTAVGHAAVLRPVCSGKPNLFW